MARISSFFRISIASGDAEDSYIYVSGVHSWSTVDALTLVPMSSGDFSSAQAVKWDFVSSYVMLPFPLHHVKYLHCLVAEIRAYTSS